MYSQSSTSIVTYLPNLNFAGQDSFTFIATDGSLNSAESVVTLNINNVNDYPQIESISDTSINEDDVFSIAIVATDLELSKVDLKRISIAAHDGISRAIVPSHTPFDGDLVFAASTAAKKMETDSATLSIIGYAAAICLSRAIARAVYEASPEKNDIYPTW